MSAAVWIALGAVFIALIPAFMAGSNKADDKKKSADGAADGGDAGSADASSSHSDGDGSDGGDGDGGGGGD